MKGIRKLFFGLILMTLIGVGFKVDAKATPGMSLEIKPPTDWGATNADFVVTLKDIESDDFPNQDGSFTYTLKVVKDGDSTKELGQVEVQLVTYNSGVDQKIQLKNESEILLWKSTYLFLEYFVSAIFGNKKNI